MPVIAMIPATSQPYYPADDQFLSPASTPAGGLAPVSDTKSETVTVTASASARASIDDTGKSFFDNLLDVVNPLEHLPIVSTIYSNLTGDKPNDFTQVAGDTLYGGPMGLLSSLGNLVFRDVTGKTIGDTVWGWVTDKGGDTMAASNDAPRQNLKPSSDMFSFLRANIGNDYDSNSTQLASNTARVTASAAATATSPNAPFTTVPIAAASAAPVQTAAASKTMTPAPAPTSSSTTTAGAAPRLLNPLPVRGAPPAHNTPSENVRAAGLASMVAGRAHLHAPASEGNAPAIQPAAYPAQQQPQNAQIASAVPPNIPVGADGIPQLDHNGEQALLAALNKNGISSAIGQQALMAYQKTMAMNPDPSNAAALAATMH